MVERGEILDLLVDRARLALAFVGVSAVLEELARRRIERDRHVVADPVAGLLDGREDEIERGLGRRQIGRKTALVAHIGVVAVGFERRAQRVKDFRAGAHRFRKRGDAERHDHEFLKIDRVVGMHAAIDDVHHRHRQEPRRRAADIAIERQLVGRGRRLGDGERHAEDGVGAEPAFVRRAVERDHGLVDLDLRLGIHAAERLENLAVDRLDRVAHALAEIAFLVAVAQLDRLMRPGRGARRHAGAAARAVFEHDIDLHGRIAAAVENFPADDVDDGGHDWSRLGPCAAASTGSARPLSCPDKAGHAGAMAKKTLQLGRPAPIPASPDQAVLDRVRNPHPDTNYVARFTFPEFTVMCPVTGQPDFATLVIDYVPKAWLVESKSLKLYLNSFRNHGAFHEECTVAIGKKLAALLKPKWLRIGGYFHPRGGMPIDVFWQAGKLPAGVWAPDQGVGTYRARG